jgi:zinc transport system substrate-binding protein
MKKLLRNMSIIHFILIIILSLAALIMAGCVGENPPSGNGSAGKIAVVATLFPLYDMAKEVGGDKADVAMLLPPGAEAHTYEPRPSDISKIARADIFLYVGAGMEPWADSLINGAENSNLLVLDASTMVRLINAGQTHEGEEAEGNGVFDPHIWLDYSNDMIIADALAEAFSQKDPKDAAYFSANAETYKSRLRELDDKYRKTLAGCKKREFITGGHNAFTYLAGRYNLTGLSAYGLSPDSEPTPMKIKEIDDLVKAHGIKYILFEDTVSPKVADAIAEGTGAKTLAFSPGENPPKADYDAGVSFISLMERNLGTLNIALECN